MGDFIIRETIGKVAILTINRPDSLNAVGTLEDCDDFVRAIEAEHVLEAGELLGESLPTREMRNAMIVAVAIYASALAVLVPAFGNHGLWAGLMVLNTARGLTMAALYPRLERRLRAV